MTRRAKRFSPVRRPWHAIAMLGMTLLAVGSARADGLARAAPKGVLRGVVSGPEGRPIPEADVWVAPPARDTLVAKTDAQGAYAFAAVPAGDVLVTVRAARFDTWNGRSHVAAGGTATADVSLAAAVVVPGRVLDARGTPIPDVRVRPILSEILPPTHHVPYMADPDVATVTDKEGRFLLDRLKPGRHYFVRFQHPRFALDERRNVPRLAGDAPEMTVRLVDAAWVSGVVVSADGSPVADASVAGGPDFVWPDGEAEPTTPYRNDRLDPGAVVRTGADGRFVVGSLRGSEAVLTVTAKGHFVEKVPVALKAGEERSGVEIRLTPGSGSVEGIVLGPKGEPLVDAWVRLQAGTTELNTDTDARGRFTLAPVTVRGAVTLGAYAPGCADLEQPGVPVGAKDVVLQMSPVARWRGRITDETGALIPIVTVDVRRTDGIWHYIRKWGTPAGGTYPQPKEGFEWTLPIRQAALRISAEGFRDMDLGPYDTTPDKTIEAGTVRLVRALK